MNIRFKLYGGSSRDENIGLFGNLSSTQKSLIAAIACVVLLTFAQIAGNPLLIYAILVFYLAIVFFAEEGDIIPLLLFFMPWSTIMKASPEAISFSSIATLLIAGRLFMRPLPIKKTMLFSAVALIAITALSKIINGYDFSASYIMFFAMIIIFPCVINSWREKISFQTCAVFFSLGILLATFTALLFANEANISNYIRSIEQTNISVIRRCGFYGDPNFFASQIIVAVGCLLVVMLKKVKYTAGYTALVVLLVACGFISGSKSFIITLVLIFLLWLLIMLANHPSRFLKAALVVAVVITLVLSSGILSEYIDQLLVRFGASANLSSFTTGRTDLWNDYAKFFMENPIDFLIGQGYTNVFKAVNKGSHNTIIQSLYQFGFFGVFALGVWFCSFSWKNAFKSIEKPKLILLCISCFFMWMGLDMLYFDDFFLTICLFFIGVYCESREEEAVI